MIQQKENKSVCKNEMKKNFDSIRPEWSATGNFTSFMPICLYAWMRLVKLISPYESFDVIQPNHCLSVRYCYDAMQLCALAPLYGAYCEWRWHCCYIVGCCTHHLCHSHSMAVLRCAFCWSTKSIKLIKKKTRKKAEKWNISNVVWVGCVY